VALSIGEAGVKSILCWGDPEWQFERLGLAPTKTYEGSAFYSRMTVWDLDEAAWARLVSDDEACHAAELLDADYTDPWTLAGACWRYAEGSNLGGCDGTANINGRDVAAWRGHDFQWDEEEDEDEEDPMPTPAYATLLDYLCDALGVSTERNVTAVAVDMAEENGMTLGELFTALQPTKAA
jgi:hypothetical protein